MKLIPINFESASPSTRFPATDTIIIAKNILVKLLTRELERMAPKDKEDRLKAAATIIVIMNAPVIGKPIRAAK